MVPNINCYINMSVCMLQDIMILYSISSCDHNHACSHLCHTLFPHTMHSFQYICLACKVTISYAPQLHLVAAHEDMVYRQKLQEGYEHLEHSIKYTDCIIWNKKIVRKTKISLLDVNKCAHKMVEVILNSNQCKTTENGPYLILPNQTWCFASML